VGSEHGAEETTVLLKQLQRQGLVRLNIIAASLLSPPAMVILGCAPRLSDKVLADVLSPTPERYPKPKHV
jgi:hypothetical protein